MHTRPPGGVCVKQMMLLGVVVGLMACEPPKPPAPGPEGGGTQDALDGGADAGLFEIQARDAGGLWDTQLPWRWSAVEEVINTAPAGGVVTGRWVPVMPTAVDRAWAGGVLLFDGGVVAVPFNESSVLVIHPNDDTYERWPVTGGAVSEGWQGGVLLHDGKVIAFPRNANRFLRIDPATKSAAPFGDDLSDVGADGGVDKFRGGVLGLNGMVYAAPNNAKFIARLDPATGRVTKIPIPPTVPRGATQGAVVFPTGDIVMFPAFDLPGLIVIPSKTGGQDEVWLLPRPQLSGSTLAAFNAGGIITGFETAVAPPHQNAYPMKYEAGVLSFMTPLPGIPRQSANAWFYGAWSTNGYIYAPPFGQRDAISFSLAGETSLTSFDPNPTVFRSVVGVVGLPDGRLIAIPHARSAWLELSPAGRKNMPMEAFTSPYLNKL